MHVERLPLKTAEAMGIVVDVTVPRQKIMKLRFIRWPQFGT